MSKVIKNFNSNKDFLEKITKIKCKSICSNHSNSIFSIPSPGLLSIAENEITKEIKSIFVFQLKSTNLSKPMLSIKVIKLKSHKLLENKIYLL